MHNQNASSLTNVLQTMMCTCNAPYSYNSHCHVKSASIQNPLRLHMLRHSNPPGVLQNCMTKDVFTQLQKISTQQSKIRTLKGKLAVYQDVANKQAETFAELQLVKRVPVAYRHCLAECMRRSGALLAHIVAADMPWKTAHLRPHKEII